MKFRKIIAAALAVCISIPAVPAYFHEYSSIPAVQAEEAVGGIYNNISYQKYSDHIKIIHCDKSAVKVVIPAEIEGLPVTSIGDEAFSECSDLESVTIPDGVTSIGDDAFFYCENLRSITIPESVTSIGNDAFGGTSWLAEKRKENPLVIINNILIDATCKGDVIIPDGVTTIGDGAFHDCWDLTSITIPDSVTSIGMWAFAYCSGLTEITIPDSVTSIGNWAFAYCSGLTEITIPDSVTSMGEYAFCNCSGLTSITIPGSVKSIGNYAFIKCSGLTSITIANGITNIGSNAFENCSHLTSITVPDSVTSIGYEAFAGCSDLTEISILNPNCKISNYAATISNTFVTASDCSFDGTIYGYDNSTAQAYAEKCGYKFESLGEAPALAMGDVNGDKTVDSSDASIVLVDYSLTSTGKESILTDAQKAAADVDKDGKIDSSDASFILKFYSYISTGGTETDMSKWMTK